jgi:translocation and assembly module TamB
MPHNRWIFWAVRIGVGVFAAFILGVAGLYLFAQTQTGLGIFARYVAKSLSDRELTVRVSELKGSLASSFTIGKITVADRKGIVAVIDDVRIDWRPLALLSGAVEIEKTSISKVAVARLPQTASPSQTNSVDDLLPGFSIKAKKIAIEEIALEQPVLGEAQILSATADLSLEENLSGAAFSLSLHRIDGGEGKAEITLDYAARPARFAARINVEEPAGGLLSHLAGLPRGVGLSVDLTGKGAPDNWRGKLILEAGSGLSAESTLALVLRNNTVSVAAEGTAEIHSLVPPELRRLFAALLRFRADVTFIPSEGISVRRFTVGNDVLELSGTGRYQTADRRLTGGITGKVRNHPSLAGLLPNLSLSDTEFDAKLAGTLDAPHVSVQFQTDSIAVGSTRMGPLTGSIVLDSISNDTFGLSGAVEAKGFAPGKHLPPGIFGNTLNISVAGKLKRNGAVSDASLSAVSGLSKAELSGRLDQNGMGDGTYSLRLEQIASLARMAGLELKGKFVAEGQFRAGLTAGAVKASTSGSFAELETTSPGILALLGKRVPFAGALDWRDGKPLTLAGMTIDPAFGQLTADGTLDTGTGDVSAKISAAVPDMRALSALAGKDLAGKATVSATLEGTIQTLSTRGQALVSGLRIDKTEIGRIGIGFNALLDGPTIKSQLRIKGRLRDQKLDGRLNGDFREGILDLSKINMAVGKNRLSGTLGLDISRKRLSGALVANVNAFSDLPGAAQLGLAGAGDFTMTTGPGHNQDIEFTGTARGIRFRGDTTPGASIGKSSVRLRLRDPLGSLTVRGEASIEDANIAGLRGAKAKLEIRGDTSKLAWSCIAEVDGTYPLSLATNGSLSLAATQSRVSVDKLEGNLVKQAFSLRAPFFVTWRKQDWRIAPIDLSVAGGRFRLSGSMAGDRLEASGQLDNLPLGIASLIDDRIKMDGRVAGTFQVSGTPRRPDIKFSMAAQKIRPADVPEEEFAGFNLKLDMRQDSDTTRAVGSLTGPDETNAALTVESRSLVSLSPISIGSEPDQPITGKLTANGRLDLIDKLVGLGDDRIAGVIRTTARITGTVGNPAIHGDMRLSGGSYEGAATGTVLRKIDAHVKFTGDAAKLASLTANDGATGRLSGTGSMKFGIGSASTDNVVIKLDRFAALRHPAAEAVVTGEIGLSGSTDAPHLTGRLTVYKGDIRIPEKLPEQVVELDVVEINGDAAQVANRSTPEEPSLAKTFPVSLDLVLKFPNRTFVRGRGLESEWKGDLMVSGKSDAPIIRGKLQAIRGTFAFAGKTFRLKSGSVFFPTSAAEPEIQATAEATLNDLVARVEISGNVSNPAIKISSDPELPQEDVLAQILFGKTTGQLSAIQAAQLAATAATLSGAGGAGIMDKVRQTLGVDVLNVEAGEGDNRSASLKAGKYLTEEIFLSVTQGTQPGSQKVGVEVQILPNITVESDISGTADSNIGLNWKWDY